MSRRFAIIALVVTVLVAPSALAQSKVYGQLLLPDGGTPTDPIRFYLARDDGQLNEWRFTDSNGRFILERLSSNVGHSITVDSDGSTYGSTTYRFVPSTDPTLRVTLNPLARKAVAGGNTVSAVSKYKPVPEAAALHEKAMKELKKNRPESAERSLRRAAELDPKFAAPLIDLGALFMQQRKYIEAEKTLQQALAADRKSIHALLNLGITLNHLQKCDEAIPILRDALRLEPGLMPAHVQLGIALLETDAFEEAEQELTRAAKSAGNDDVVTQLYLGKLYARTGDFEKSIAAFTTYLQKVPNASNGGEVRALIERMTREMAAKH